MAGDELELTGTRHIAMSKPRSWIKDQAIEMKTVENLLKKTKEMLDQLSDDINTFIISDKSVASITRFLQRHCIGLSCEMWPLFPSAGSKS